MAPDETRTISRPTSRVRASTPTSCSIRSGSMPPSAVVSEDEPTLTTIRRAPASSSRIVQLTRQVFRSMFLDVIRPIVLPTTLYGWPFFDQSLVLAARAQNLCADVDLRSEVEDHGIRPSNNHTVPGLRAQLQQSVLDANPVQPVSEVTDSLSVGEVGLAYPPLRLVAAYPPQLAVQLHGELGLITDRLRPDDDACRRWRRLGGTSSHDQTSHSVDQLVQALAASGGNRKDLKSPVAQLTNSELGNLQGIGDVDLVQRDEPRPIFQPSMLFQLRLDDIKIGDGIAAPFVGGAVDHMDDRSASLDMTQKVEPETAALTSTCDQARYISDGKADITSDHDPQIGHQGRERIVGDLGAGAGD